MPGIGMGWVGWLFALNRFLFPFLSFFLSVFDSFLI